jgi:4-amino-4-deoxy-L-arabinose transferase-like glycosyltransferase
VTSTFARRWRDRAGTREGLIVLVLAEIAVLYLLTRFALFTRMPYFVDEGTHARWVHQASRSTSQLFVSLEIGKEPLLVWLGVVLAKVGIVPLDAVRLVSIGAGLGTVAVVGLLGRRLGGTWVGVTAAAICTVLPFLVVHDVIGIMEPLVTFLVALALYLEIVIAQRPDLRVAALLGGVLAAALLTKESGKVAIVLLPVSLLCFDWRPEGRRRRLGLWAGCAAVALVLAECGSLLLHSSSLYAHARELRQSSFGYPVRSIKDGLADPVKWWNISWPLYRPALSGYFTLPLLALTIAGAGLALRRQARMALLLLVWIVVPFGAAILLPLSPYPRHILYLAPPMVVFAAYALVPGVEWLVRRWPGWRGAALAAAGTLALFAPALLRDARVLAHPATAHYPGGDETQYVTGPVAGSPLKPLVHELRRRAGGRHVVIATDGALYEIPQELLDYDERFDFVLGVRGPKAARARFVLTDELPFRDLYAAQFLRQGNFRQVFVYQRPRGGATLRLYERG